MFPPSLNSEKRIPKDLLSQPISPVWFGELRKLILIQYTLDLRKPDLRKNLDLRKIVGATDFFST
jgi:hypothetical protein